MTDIIKSTDAIINELELFKFDIRDNNLERADNRLLLIQRYLDQLQRDAYMATRVSGEVK